MPLTEYLFSAPVALVLFAVSACLLLAPMRARFGPAGESKNLKSQECPMFRKLLLALAAVCLMTGSAVAADAFPNRPITIVVPFAAGGETDLVAVCSRTA